ncbi:Uncharacterized protein FKW44_009786, partial [Caligus rogercresseyi]
DPHVGESNSTPVWLCPSLNCGTAYDSTEIETHLLDVVRRKTMGWVLQDLKCLKCDGVKEANMAKYCSCAGNFDTVSKSSDIKQLLLTFKGIAEHYKMPLLLELVEWTIEMN